MGETPVLGLMEIWQSEWRLTLIVCLFSLVAVCLPLTKGALLCWRARRATTAQRSAQADGDPSLSEVARLVRDVCASSQDQIGQEATQPFVRDAAKQLVIDDYETCFAQPISMYANILPPIGFIGTTCGLAILLLSMRLSEDILQMGALALALSSTIFALVGYAILESAKIHLYGRLARSIDDGMEALG